MQVENANISEVARIIDSGFIPVSLISNSSFIICFSIQATDKLMNLGCRL
jgi:hypothetical protein